MTPARFLAAALALTVVLSTPSTALPDRYKAEATDPARGLDNDADRPKRAFAAAWTNLEELSKWKPATHQLSRPYIIPVYGVAGKRPIYFPPQRLNLNPGTPADNPLPNRPFMGPGYLPPTHETTTTMNIINRFNPDDDDDDRPIWGTSVDGSVVASASKEGSIIPTRPPKLPGMGDFPPLVHNINGGGTNALAVEAVAEESAPVARMTTALPVTTGPSNCVWAIVTCCSASHDRVPDSCFEQRGCPGPFWGSSPCESDFAKAAINSALNYYSGA